jgi:hypothetical protein
LVFLGKANIGQVSLDGLHPVMMLGGQQENQTTPANWRGFV